MNREILSIENIMPDYKEAIEASGIISMSDANGIITYVNQNFCSLSKFSAKDIIGKTYRQIRSDFHPEQFYAEIWQTINTGTKWKGEIHNRAKDGSLFWLSVNIIPFTGSDGKPFKYMAISHDITLLKAYADEHKEHSSKTQQELDRFLEMVSEVFFSFDISAARPLTVSPSCFKLFGYTKDEMENEPEIYRRLVHPVDIEKLFAYHAETLMKGEQSFFVFRIIKKDHKMRWVEWRLVPTMDDKGNFIRCDGLCWDITDRENTQEKINAAIRALQLSEDKFRKIFEAGLEGMALMTSDGEVVDVNETMCRMLGYPRSEMVKIKRDDFLVNQNGGEHASVTTRKQTGWYFGPAQYRTSKGTIKDVEVSTSIITGADGRQLVFICSRDVTDKVLAEQKLEDSEKRFRAILENGYDIITLMDGQGNSFYRSPSYYNTFGYTREEMTNYPAYHYVHEEDGQKLKDIIAELVTMPGAEVSAEWRQLHKDGHWVWLEGKATNMLHDTSIKGIVNNYRDITARKLWEQKLADANQSLEKKVIERTEELMEANKLLESYSYSVAHDLRSPLRVLAGYAKVLSTSAKHKLEKQDLELLETIITSSKKMSDLVTDLLTFSRVAQEKIKPEEVNMDALVADAVESLKHTEAAGNTQFKLHALGNAYCDKALLKQVWINLIGNACKYSAKNKNAHIEIGTEQTDGRKVYYIKDNGVGFDNEHADKLFDAFYRLHHDNTYEGTGVGLALVKSVIANHSGKIWATGKANEGATFRFYLGA